jgi:Smg protein
MFEILVYLFENFFGAESRPDEEVLARKLSAAGFGDDEINRALNWVSGLDTLPRDGFSEALADSTSVRCFADSEQAKLDAESRGYLAFLEGAGIIGPAQREWVIDRALALDDEEISLDKVKWIILLMLWNQGQVQDYLFLEDLPSDGGRQVLH